MRLISVVLLSFFLSFSSSLFAADPVNINTADVSTLSDGLNGVGLKKAQAIVEYRNSYGPFKSIEELKAVKGIGDSLLDKNRDNIVIK
jgi:competence protein ComEA